MATAAHDPPSATTTSPVLCGLCPEAPTITCTGCSNIQYCSTTCQDNDAPQHNTLCATFKDFQDRPSDDHYRAIHFPVDGDNPRFVWIKYSSQRDSHAIDPAELAPYVAGTPAGDLSFSAHHGMSPPRAYKNTIIVERDLQNRQPVNQCLARMIGAHRLGGYLAHALKYTYDGANGTGGEEYYDEEDEGLVGDKVPAIALDLDTTSLSPLLAYMAWHAQQNMGDWDLF